MTERVVIDIGAISRVRALELLTSRLQSSTIVGSGGVVVTGNPADGFSVSVPFANAFDFVAYDNSKALTAFVVKAETDLKLNRSAKATGAEAIAGSDVEKWVGPFALKQAINAKIVEVAASENPDLTALQDLIDDRMAPDFANAVFDDDGLSGAAMASLANVNSPTGRNALALPGYRSMADLPAGLSPSAYTAAATELVQFCCDNALAVYIPVGFGKGLLNGPIEADGVCSMWGEGAESYFLTTGFDGPVIHFHITTPVDYSRHFFRNFHIYNNIKTAANSNSAGIQISGSASFAYAEFFNISSTGCYATIKNTMDTFPSAFGEESFMSHCTFEQINTFYEPTVINAKYGVWHTAGSGTANSYRNMRGSLSRSGTAPGDIAVKPAHVRIDGGPGVVGGDCVFDGSITALDVAAISLDPSLAYQNAIRVAPHSQVDAQATALIRFDPGLPAGSTYGLCSEGVVGGEIDLSAGYGLLQGSIIRHQGVGIQEAGVARGNLASGAVTKEVGVVTMRAFSGGLVEVSADGVVSNAGAGTAYKKFLLSSNATTAAVREVESYSAPIGFTGIQVVANISGLAITFSVVVTSPSSGSEVDAQIVVRGGHCKLKRGSA